MSARPLVRVFDAKTGEESAQVELPAVFSAPIRRDVVESVHKNMNKNARQAYAVSKIAGHQTSAESWGTGRAVARIPRVGGGGTGRSGQGAFGNMCRSGRMFAPTKTWRKWHRKINTNERRYAVASALAASAVPALVMARGHRIEKVNEVPLVISGLEGLTKTRDALATLAKFGADEDVQHAKDSRKIRAGKGKMRNRRYVSRRGPLVVYAEDNGLTKAFRNLPGVELCNVDSLNLLQLAPGGHMGRFCVWTQSAFERLNALFGTSTTKATLKSDYHLPTASMANPDLARIINSAEIQEVVRAAVVPSNKRTQKKNPLKNKGMMHKLNPYQRVTREAEVAKASKTAELRTARLAKRRAARKDKAARAASTARYNAMMSDEWN
jgi:large subunit ribosomal protein L4e